MLDFYPFEEAIDYTKYSRYFTKDAIDFISRFDPSGRNSYITWLTKLILKKSGNKEQLNRYEVQYYFENQLQKAHELLKKYDTLRNKKIFSDTENNIMNFDSLEKLSALIDNYNSLYTDIVSQKEVKEGIDYKKLYQDDTWVVVIPLTLKGSRKYGKGTKWCTAGEDPDAELFFNTYTHSGNLFIIINKKTGQKWQLQAKRGTFRDEQNEDIFLKEHGTDFLYDLPDEAKFAIVNEDPKAKDYLFLDLSGI